MARNGSGTYNLPAGQPVVTGTTISSTTFNTLTSDLATAITGSIAADGQTPITANLSMGGFKLTGLGAASAATDSVRLSALQNSQGQQLGTIAGTNTITAFASPTLTAYANGQTFRFAPAGTNTGATTINIDSLGAKNVYYNGAALTGGEIPGSGMVTITYDGTQFNLTASAAAGSSPFTDATAIIKNSSDATKLVKISAASVATGTTRTVTAPNYDVYLTNADNGINDFRLTLTTGTPVTTTDVSTATTVYCCPYKGNRIALYDGSNWNVRTSAEFSLALGTLTASLPYDVFCYDNASVPTLEFLAWTNTTTRATALAYQDGVLVKSGTTTRRYLGTFYTISTTQTSDTKTNRYLYNYYNRVIRNTQTQFSADRTVASASYAEFNSEIRAGWIVGVAEDPHYVSVTGAFDQTSDSTNAQIAVGIDSGTTAQTGLATQANGASAWAAVSLAGYTTAPQAVGLHFFTLMARTTSTNVIARGTEDTTATKTILHTAMAA